MWNTWPFSGYDLSCPKLLNEIRGLNVCLLTEIFHQVSAEPAIYGVYESSPIVSY